ncbi:squalene/phytoene synthase family protein [Aurantiacibacter hainanensis]|uniref:squalene/phytoene synthase family protein n=1 Tax=Aurantiacibacter hainanensis TaxID=3076114 RepID=UPI0030C68CC9
MSTGILETLPLPQRLALSYAPRGRREDILALLALNTRLSGIVRQHGEPVIAQMKLAWWRDRFAEDRDSWPIGEPLLALLAHWQGDTRMLGHLVDGWEGLLAERLGRTEIEQFAQGHALAWVALCERKGGAEPDDALRQAAKQFALADLALNLSDENERALAIETLDSIGRGQQPLPRAARPLAVLRGLALRALGRGNADLLDGGGAMALALRLGIVGR